MPVATFANIQRVCLCCVSALFVDIACNALFICYTNICIKFICNAVQYNHEKF